MTPANFQFAAFNVEVQHLIKKRGALRAPFIAFKRHVLQEVCEVKRTEDLEEQALLRPNFSQHRLFLGGPVATGYRLRFAGWAERMTGRFGLQEFRRRNSSAGVLKARHFLGRLLIQRSMPRRWVEERASRFNDLGSKRRRIPMVFSTEPFSQLWKGAQKKERVPRRLLISRCSQFSEPLS